MTGRLEKIIRRVKELKDLASRATPGPWHVVHRHVGFSPNHDECAGLGLEIAEVPVPDRANSPRAQTRSLRRQHQRWLSCLKSFWRLFNLVNVKADRGFAMTRVQIESNDLGELHKRIMDEFGYHAYLETVHEEQVIDLPRHILLEYCDTIRLGCVLCRLAKEDCDIASIALRDPDNPSEAIVIFSGSIYIHIGDRIQVPDDLPVVRL